MLPVASRRIAVSSVAPLTPRLRTMKPGHVVSLSLAGKQDTPRPPPRLRRPPKFVGTTRGAQLTDCSLQIFPPPRVDDSAGVASPSRARATSPFFPSTISCNRPQTLLVVDPSPPRHTPSPAAPTRPSSHRRPPSPLPISPAPLRVPSSPNNAGFFLAAASWLARSRLGPPAPPARCAATAPPPAPLAAASSPASALPTPGVLSATPPWETAP